MPKKRRRPHSSLTRADCRAWADARLRELYPETRKKKPISPAVVASPSVPFVPPPWGSMTPRPRGFYHNELYSNEFYKNSWL